MWLLMCKLLAGAWKGEKKYVISGVCKFLSNEYIEQFGFVWWFVCLKRRRRAPTRDVFPITLGNVHDMMRLKQ